MFKQIVLAVFGVFISSSTFAQRPPDDFEGYFYIDGKVDSIGTTHLLYRLQKDESESHQQAVYIDNSLYDLNTETNTDSIFIRCYIADRGTYFGGSSNDFDDYLFLNQKLSHYLIASTGAGIDAVASIRHYQKGYVYKSISDFNLHLTRSRTTDRIYAASRSSGRTALGYHNGTLWPYDEYRNVDSLLIDFYVIMALSDTSSRRDVLIGHPASNQNVLVKSKNLGTTLDTVNTDYYWSNVTESYIDPDSTHLYFNFSSRSLIISNNRANSGSFYRTRNNFQDNLHLALDDSTSGQLFATSDNRIWLSTDYGSEFRPYYTVDDSLTDIYYDAYHRNLYATTPNDILKINSNSPPDTIKHTVFTGIDEPKPPSQPKQITLSKNYPNPFNPNTTITYTLNRPTRIKLTLYDATGRRLKVIEQGRFPAGTYHHKINMSNYASGVYFYTLQTPDRRLIRKMMMLK